MDIPPSETLEPPSYSLLFVGVLGFLSLILLFINRLLYNGLSSKLIYSPFHINFRNLFVFCLSFSILYFSYVVSYYLAGLIALIGVVYYFIGKKDLKLSLEIIQNGYKKLLDRLLQLSGYATEELEVSPKENAEDLQLYYSLETFSSTYVRQIMTKREDLIAISNQTTFDELIGIIEEYRYSRIPVYDTIIDHIVGVLHVKDLLKLIENNETALWQKVIRTPVFVNQDEKIDLLLQEFKKTKRHLALVRDFEKKIIGLITLEDIIEEIIGEIQDEYDDEQLYYREIDEFAAVYDAKTLLEDCRQKFDIPTTEIEENSENLSIGGLMMLVLGRIPKNGQFIKIGNHIVLTTELADKKKIYRVKIEYKP